MKKGKLILTILVFLIGIGSAMADHTKNSKFLNYYVYYYVAPTYQPTDCCYPQATVIFCDITHSSRYYYKNISGAYVLLPNGITLYWCPGGQRKSK